jgi:hypothetical protein
MLRILTISVVNGVHLLLSHSGATNWARLEGTYKSAIHSTNPISGDHYKLEIGNVIYTGFCPLPCKTVPRGEKYIFTSCVLQGSALVLVPH